MRTDDPKNFIDARFDKLEKTLIIRTAQIVYSAIGFAAALFALWNKLI